MAEIILEPYAIQQHWRLPGPDPDWRGFLAEYLGELAQACQASGRVVIGHIKALTVFPDGGFYRISVVEAYIPATEEGMIPTGTSSIDLTLNVIVYGLTHEHQRELTTGVSKQLARKFQAEVTEPDQPGEPHHHHH